MLTNFPMCILLQQWRLLGSYYCLSQCNCSSCFQYPDSQCACNSQFQRFLYNAHMKCCVCMEFNFINTCCHFEGNLISLFYCERMLEEYIVLQRSLLSAIVICLYNCYKYDDTLYIFTACGLHSGYDSLYIT